jgi:hypothetical protein
MLRYIFIVSGVYMVGLLLPIWAFFIVACLCLRSELVFIAAFLIDVQYGLIESIFLWYILSALGAALVAELLRPRMYIHTV